MKKPNLRETTAALRDAKDLLQTTVRTGRAVAPMPARWLPLALTVVGVGVLLSLGGPLWRVRPVRRVAKAGATTLLLRLARRS